MAFRVIIAQAIACTGGKALQRFDDWTGQRETEARALIGYAADLGAPGLALCPAHEPRDMWDDAVSDAKLRENLGNLRPFLSGRGVKGDVEPLGMTHAPRPSRPHRF